MLRSVVPSLVTVFYFAQQKLSSGPFYGAIASRVVVVVAVVVVVDIDAQAACDSSDTW